MSGFGRLCVGELKNRSTPCHDLCPPCNLLTLSLGAADGHILAKTIIVHRSGNRGACNKGGFHVITSLHQSNHPLHIFT